MQTEEIKYIAFPTISEKRGKLMFAEAEKTVPFPIKRVYCIYDVPIGETERGGHAHTNVKEIIVPILGNFDIICNNGFERTEFHMDKKHVGLYIPEMVWVRVRNFSQNAVCMVISSEYYDEKNYVRKYGDFIQKVEDSRREKS